MTMRLRSCALERWTSHKTDTWPILETHCVYIVFRDIWCFTKPNRSQTMFIIYMYVHVYMDKVFQNIPPTVWQLERLYTYTFSSRHV